MKRLITILLLLVSLNAWSQCIISGRFVNKAGKGIPQALCQLSSSKMTKEALSDSLGYFKLDVEPGDYKGSYSASGYKTLRFIINLVDPVDLGEVVLSLDENYVPEIKTDGKSGVRVTSKVVAREGGEPVEAAAIRFLKTDSTFVVGGTTDATGTFHIGLPEPGEYMAIVSALGFTMKSFVIKADGEDTGIPIIALDPDIHTLDEVTITGKSITRVNGHLQITPEKALVKHASTGYQLLQNIMLPGIEVDAFDGKVSLFGHQVSLYINGEPADYRMVQNLRPKDVKNIEYYDAPIGRYSRDFAAINYVTKEQTTGGYVTLDAQQCIGGYLSGRYNGFTKINKGKNSYYVFAGYNVENGATDRVEKTESFDLISSSIGRTFNTTGGRNRDHGEYGQFTFQHTGKGRYVSLSAGLTGNHSVSTASGRTVYSEPLNLTQTTDSHKKSTGLSPRLSYYGQFNIKEKDLLITTFSASYSHSTYDYIYSEDEQGVLSDTRDKMYRLSAQAIYQKNLGHRNTLSFILMDMFKVASTNYSGTYSSWQHLWNSEALFLVEYSHQLSNKFRFTARPGLSMVDMGLHGNEHRHFYFPRFYTQLTYNPTKSQQINISVAVGNSLTDLSSRTAADQPIDLIMTRRGNPDLKDVKMYQMNFSYGVQLGKVNVNSLLELIYYPNAIVAGYIPENDRLIHRVYNGDYKHAKYSPGVTWRITDSFRTSLSGTLGHVSYSNLFDRQQLNYANGSLSLMYFIGDFSFNLRGSTTSHGLSSTYVYSFTPMNVQASVAWTHGNWRVDAWARSLSGQTTKRWIDTDAYCMNQSSHGRYYGMVKVAYTFDFGKKVQREQKQADTFIDNNILK